MIANYLASVHSEVKCITIPVTVYWVSFMYFVWVNASIKIPVQSVLQTIEKLKD